MASVTKTRVVLKAQDVDDLLGVLFSVEGFTVPGGFDATVPYDTWVEMGNPSVVTVTVERGDMSDGTNSKR